MQYSFNAFFFSFFYLLNDFHYQCCLIFSSNTTHLFAYYFTFPPLNSSKTNLDAPLLKKMGTVDWNTVSTASVIEEDQYMTWKEWYLELGS